MKVKVHYKSFSNRDAAANWMEQKYAQYDEHEVVSSNFAEDNDSVTAYITVKVGEQSKNIEG